MLSKVRPKRSQTNSEKKTVRSKARLGNRPYTDTFCSVSHSSGAAVRTWAHFPPSDINLIIERRHRIPRHSYRKVKKRAAFEILRVGANLCRDHGKLTVPDPAHTIDPLIGADQNRGALLEAGFPQKVVEILEGYSDLVDPQLHIALPLSLQDLRIIKTSIGVLINLCIRHGTFCRTCV